MGLLMNGDDLRQTLTALTEAISQLESATIIVEDIQLLASDDPGRLEHTLALLKALAAHDSIRLVVTTTSQAYHRIFRDDYVFGRLFDAIEIQPAISNPQSPSSCNSSRIEVQNHQIIMDEAVLQSVQLGARFGHGRALPMPPSGFLKKPASKPVLNPTTMSPPPIFS